VLSTPPAFVLSQNQTLQTKTTHQKTGESESEKSDQATKKNLGTKSHTLTRGSQSTTKTNNKQKPPNTLLSSQTTHLTSMPGRATNPR
ncbi:MAG: hypothetical protein WBC17_12985, partial [Mycobacterium sp.]